MIYEDLSWIFLEWRRYRQRQIAPFGVTIQQYALMRALSRDGQMCAHSAAEFLHCDKPTMSIVSGNLVKKGWVERVTDPEDRRLILLRLTDEGERAVRDIESQLPAHIDRPFDALTPEERRVLAALLKKGRAHLTEILSGEI